MRVRILPYKNGSKSASALSRALSQLQIRRSGSRFIPRATDLILNWGSTSYPNNQQGVYINKPEAVAVASNKAIALRLLAECGVKVVEFTSSRDIAQNWVNEGITVFGRSVLNGRSGRGIVLYESGSTVTHQPLYTKRVKREAEFRIHVANGNIIDIQQKKKRAGYEGTSLIWNHDNGYVYCREGVSCPEGLKAEAIRAVEVLGLNFGAVDIAQVKGTNAPCIFEVNTAPGLEGTTLSKYVSFFKGIIENER